MNTDRNRRLGTTYRRKETMQPDERYQVRNPDIERALRTLAAVIDERTPDGWGWGLFLVPFGDNEAVPTGVSVPGSGKAAAAKAQGAVFWISNSDRAGMMDAIKGWIEDNERRQKDMRELPKRL